jgi:transcriptional regulator with GAF, ATPase, and Fis domain
MQLVVRAPSQPQGEGEARQFERLVATLSSTLTALSVDQVGSVLDQTLWNVILTLGVDRAAFVELNEDGGIHACYSQTRLGGTTPDGDADPDLRLRNWLADHVRRKGAAPLLATEDRSLPWRGSTLAVPVATDGGGCIAALVVGSLQRWREWPFVLEDRTRLIAEILGSALRRIRQEAALQQSLAEIDRLNQRLAAENACLKEEIKTFHDFDEIIGESEVMRAALERLGQVAPLNCSVLLFGETGTGKELFARALHDRSRRRASPIVRVNCAALPPTLIETELFGHEKGAFTGAVGQRQGRFELANGGTIFLDEIGDLQYEMQGKLLRVLQEGEFERVGSSRSRRVDVRVVAATHHNLEQAVAEGRFRADLFYRLSVFPIHVPPLRERCEDIPSLVWFFIHRHQRELGRHITKVPNHVISALQAHDWPGNVRELENIVERAMIRSTDDTLQLDGPFGDRPRELPRSIARDTLDDVQRSHIEHTLRQCGWRINGVGNAAERLGLHPNTLRFRMKKLGIQMPRDRRPAEPDVTQRRGG